MEVEMRIPRLVLAIFSIAALFGGALTIADGHAIKTMANIAANLNHFPSDDDKAALQGIIDSDSSSAAETAIATALMNLQHKVSEGDAAKLLAVVEDDSADESARMLASIVIGINHSAGDEAKAALAALATS